MKLVESCMMQHQKPSWNCFASRSFAYKMPTCLQTPSSCMLSSTETAKSVTQTRNGDCYILKHVCFTGKSTTFTSAVATC